MFSLLIFDLDGTLIDSRKDLAFSVNATLRDLGRAPLPNETIYGYVGNGVSRLIADATKSADPTDPDNPALLERANRIFEAHYLAHLTDCTTLYPGIEGVLNYYRDRQKVVVTNKRSRFTRKIIENLGIAHLFEQLICADEVGTLKPDPAMLQCALQKMDRKADEALVIGDMENDIKAARAAGISICAVGYGFETAGVLKKAQPDFFVETVDGLINLAF